MLPTGWTKLVELAGKKAPQVAITNVVDEVMNDVTEHLANAREVLLQTDGAGTLGISPRSTGVRPTRSTYKVQAH
jgi:hypothetical protein